MRLPPEIDYHHAPSPTARLTLEQLLDALKEDQDAQARKDLEATRKEEGKHADD